MQVKTGIPEKNGMYVCYLDLPMESNFMEKKLLVWFNPCWCYPGSDQLYRGNVNCWIGPLPSPKKDELSSIGSVAYAIATKNQAKNGCFSEGPFETLILAQEVYGEQGDYIYKIDALNKEQKIVRKWDSNENRWLTGKEVKRKKFLLGTK